MYANKNIILEQSSKSSDNFFDLMYQIKYQISYWPCEDIESRAKFRPPLTEGRARPLQHSVIYLLEYSNSITFLSVSFVSSALIYEKHNQNS